MEDEIDITEDSSAPTDMYAPVDPKLAMAGQLIDEAVGMLQQAIRLMGQVPGAATFPSTRSGQTIDDDSDNRIIEGVFDGQRMIGPDGHHYSVPANYASKSKLIEGDLLKLTITAKGAFVYKQVGPIPRRRLLGELTKSVAGGEYVVKVGRQKYKVLTASVTYFHAQEGDEVTILVPENSQSAWAAVENVIKKSSGKGGHEYSSAYLAEDDLSSDVE